jgi:DHA1 family multidrug resistance protein-like MFS transporter
VFERLNRAYFGLFREYPALIDIAIITGAAQTAFALLNIYALPMYLISYLHWSGKLAGTIFATFLIFETIFKFPMGRLSDRHGRRWFVALGPLLISLNPIFLVHLPQRLWMLMYPLRAADGAGGGALWPPLFALIGDLVRSERRAAAMAFVNIVYAGAIAAGLALGVLAFYLTHNHSAPFYVATVALLVAGVTAWLRLPRVPAREESLDEAMPSIAMVPRFSHSVHVPTCAPGPFFSRHTVELVVCWARNYSILLQAMLISFLLVMSGMTVSGFLVPFVDGLRFTLRELVIIAVAMAVPAVALGLPLGHLSDRWGKSRAVRLALVVTAVLMWLMPAATRSPVALAIIGAVLLGVNIMGIPAWLALISDLAPTAHRGSVMGLVAAAEGVGAGVGPMLGGYLWDIQHAYIFYGAACLLTLCACVALIVLRGFEERQRPA